MKKLILITVLFISFLSSGYTAEDYQSSAEDKGAALGRQLSDVLGSEEGMEEYLSGPISSGVFKNYSEENPAVFKVGFCPEGARNNFLKVTYSGDHNKTRRFVAKQDLDGDNEPEYTFRSNNISGVCMYGYISCSGSDVKPLNGCSVWRLVADTNGRLTEERVTSYAQDLDSPSESASLDYNSLYNNPDYTNIVGSCECANDRCLGNRQFDNRIIDIINGAIIHAIETGGSGIAITNMDMPDEKTFIASATDFAKCDLKKYGNNSPYGMPRQYNGKTYDIEELKDIYTYKQDENYAFENLEAPAADVYYSDMGEPNTASNTSSTNLEQVTTYKKRSQQSGQDEVVTGMNYTYTDPISGYKSNRNTDASDLFMNTIPSIQEGVDDPSTPGKELSYNDQRGVRHLIGNIPAGDPTACAVKTCIVRETAKGNDATIFHDGSNRSDTQQCPGGYNGKGRTGEDEEDMCKRDGGADQVLYNAYPCDDRDICQYTGTGKIVSQCGCNQNVTLETMFNDPRASQAVAILSGISEGLKGAVCKTGSGNDEDAYKPMRSSPEDVPQTYTEDVYWRTMSDLSMVSNQTQYGVYGTQRQRATSMNTNQMNSGVSSSSNLKSIGDGADFQSKLNRYLSREKSPLSENKKTVSSSSTKKEPAQAISSAITGAYDTVIQQFNNMMIFTDLTELTADVTAVNGAFMLTRGTVLELMQINANGGDIAAVIEDDAKLNELINQMANNADASMYDTSTFNFNSVARDIAMTMIRTSYYNFSDAIEMTSAEARSELLSGMYDVVDTFAEQAQDEFDEKALGLALDVFIPFVPLPVANQIAQLIVNTNAWAEFQGTREDILGIIYSGAMDMVSDVDEDDARDMFGDPVESVSNMLTECDIDNIRIFQGRRYTCKKYEPIFSGKGLAGKDCCDPKRIDEGAMPGAVAAVGTMLMSRTATNIGFNAGLYFGMPTKVFAITPPLSIPSAVPFLPSEFQVFGGINALSIVGGIVGTLAAQSLFASCPEHTITTRHFRKWVGNQDIGKEDSSGRCAYIKKKKKYLKLGFIKILQWTRYEYCCFDSLLARIIWDHGRNQLRTGTTDCRGFTLEEFQKIDFNDIDYSEWTDYILKNVQNEASDAEETITMKHNIVDPRMEVYYEEGEEGFENKAQEIIDGINGFF
jgi:hypothetical protein